MKKQVPTEEVEYPCPKCGTYTKPYMHSRDGFAYMICPKCNVQYKTSVAVSANFRKFCSKVGSAPNRSPSYYTSSEEKVRYFLQNRGLLEGLDFFHNARVGPFKNEKNRKVYYWVDFAIPKYKLIIEVSPSIWHCYSEDTLILTADGLKSYKELRQGDLVATLNGRGYLEYQPIKDLKVFSYQGPMLELKMQSIDLLVTPTHKIFLRQRHKPWTFRDASSLPKVFELKRDAKWKGEIFQPPFPVSLKTWLKFLAWYLTEGSVHLERRKGNYTICITQKTHKQYVARLLRQLPWKFSYYRDAFTTHNKELFMYLAQFGKSREKFIPKEVKNLPRKYLRLFIKELLKGDGSGETTFYTSSEKMLSDFIEISLKAGFACTYSVDTRVTNRFGGPVFKINLTKKYLTPRHERKDSRKWVYYSGKVWCVEVPNHLVYVFRNGKGCWCGNSMWNREEADERKNIILTNLGWKVIHLDEKDLNQLNKRRKKSKYPKTEKVRELYTIFNCLEEYEIPNGEDKKRRGAKATNKNANPRERQ